MPVKKWEAILVPIILAKLDAKLFENGNYTLIVSFIKIQFPHTKFLWNICSSVQTPIQKHHQNCVCKIIIFWDHNQKHRLSLRIKKKPSNNCPICKKNHNIYDCKEFLGTSIEKRIKEINFKTVYKLFKPKPFCSWM